MKPTADELGYTYPPYKGMVAPPDFDFVPVGQKIKRGDEYLPVSDGSAWTVLDDKYINATIQPKSCLTRRRMRWDCFHLREKKDRCCPVCLVFHRSITTIW